MYNSSSSPSQGKILSRFSLGSCSDSRLTPSFLSSYLGIRFTFLTQSDQSKFEQIFSQTAAQFGGNKISGNLIALIFLGCFVINVSTPIAQAVSELLRRSNLDNDSLAKIW